MSDFYFTEALNNFKLFYAPVCESTNSVVRSLLGSYSATGPVCVYSFHQTAGRGQGSNLWVSNPGENVAMTVAVDMIHFGGNAIALNKAITIAVAQAISAICGEPALIKWPNDIMLRNLKCSGLLLETSRENKETFVLAGIGINVNQKSWPESFRAGSLVECLGNRVELTHVVHEVISFISQNINKLKRNDYADIHKEFDALLWQRGATLLLEMEDGATKTAKVLGVDAAGRLIFEDKEHHIMHLHHGQVRIAKNNSVFFKG